MYQVNKSITLTSSSKNFKMKGDTFVTAVSQVFPETEKEKTVPQCYTASYCNFYSYFLIFPFEISWCQASGRFIVKSSRIRKILCYISHTLAILAVTPYLIGCLHNFYLGWTKPTYLLTGATNIICYLTSIDFVRTFWHKSELIMETTNWQSKMEIAQHHIPIYKIVLLCVFPSLPTIIDNPLHDLGNELLGLIPSTEYSFNSSFFPSHEYNFGFWYFPIYTFFLYGHLYYMVSTGFILAMILTIHQSLMQLNKPKELVKENSADLALYQGFKIETEIRNLVSTTNAVIGEKVLLEYFLMLSFYATTMDFFEGKYETSVYHKIHVFLYLLFSGAFWLMACETQCVIRSYIKRWTHAYRTKFLLNSSPEKLKQHQTSSLAFQMESDEYCISSRCFNITYGFLGSMAGLIITYSTIMYQMKSDKCKLLD